MPLAVLLRVKSSILAVPMARHHGFVTIPVGSMIETADDLSHPGFRRVTFDDRELLVFARDIRERTERIDVWRAG